MKALQMNDKRRILIVRKVATTLRQSTWKLFLDLLHEWGLYDYSRINKSNYEIELPNGAVLLFTGIDDPEKIKSITGIDDIWIEEATELSENDFNQLNLRLRSRKKNPQIHLTFNPIGKNNWVYKRWFKDGYVPKDNEVIIHSTYKDNPFLDEENIRELEYYMETDYIFYQIYALGEFATLDKKVFTNVSIDNFDFREMIKANHSLKALFGLDFGYTADPTAFIAVLLDDKNKKIYVYDEFYERGLLNNEIANLIIRKGYKKEVIQADSASPKDIDELKRLEIERIRGVKKGPGSILNGIQFLQQYEIIINESCVNTIEEIENYAWTKDKSGEYINKPVDMFNHLMDALRYAVSSVNNESTKIKILDRRKFGL